MILWLGQSLHVYGAEVGAGAGIKVRKITRKNPRMKVQKGT